MRTKRIIAVAASPLAAAALAFSPALMTQAVADTTHASAVSAQAPNVKSPMAQGATDGAKDGRTDGENCQYRTSDSEYSPTKHYPTAADRQTYKSAYNHAYDAAYKSNFDRNACEEE